MLHRVLDLLEGVHARHGDNKGAVGHQRCRLTNDRHYLVAVVEVADKESADGFHCQRHSRVTDHCSNIADRIGIVDVDHVGPGSCELGERCVVAGQVDRLQSTKFG